jgi:hypothetical protein
VVEFPTPERVRYGGRVVRKLFLFLAVLFAGIIAGGQYLVWWDYNPSGNAAAFYVEKLQYAIRVIGTPLFSVQILTALFTVVSAIMWRRSRPIIYLLGAAAALCLIGVLLTFFGNIPLLNQIAAWNSASPPENWLAVTMKWWWIHNVRFAIQLSAFILLILSAFLLGNRAEIDR